MSACGLAACASTEPPATQVVRVDTPRCAPARCTLSNDLGSWQVARTPGEVTVRVSSQPLRAVCVAEDGAESSGGAPASRQATDHSGAATGLVVGSAAGIALGAAALAIFPPLGIMAISAGATSGLAGGSVADATRRQFSYPPQLSIALACDAAQASPGAPAARGVGVAVRGLSEAEALAAGIGARGAVLVTRVGGEGAAAAAGLRSGDIVLAVNGRAIQDAADLEQLVVGAAPGTPLALQVWRDRRTIGVTVSMPGAAP